MALDTPKSPDSRPYVYQKLHVPDAVRLILLNPSPDLNSPLEGSLFPTTLSNCQNDLIENYTALSYVWGDPTRIATIEIGGQSLGITASLNSALRYLRDQTRVRRIWADAVCINQDDIEEKNQQVKQMATVYAIAHHTIIWVGESNAETEQFFGELKKQSYHRFIGRPNEAPEFTGHAGGSYNGADTGVKILTRQWFKRIWVLQELVQSRDPWVQCGAICIRWIDFKEHFIGEPYTQMSPENVRLIEGMASLHSQHQLGVFGTRSIYGSSDPRAVAVKLLNLLLSRRGLGVEDPRDMLFAHVGLLGNSQLSQSFQTLIEVDYAKNESLVFFQIAHFITEAFQDYRLLSLLEYRHEAHIPSFAPNWTANSPVVFNSIPTALGLDDTISGEYFPPNPESLNLWMPEHLVLACAGWQLARIATVQPNLHGDIPPLKIQNKFPFLQRGVPRTKFNCKITSFLHLLELAYDEFYSGWYHLLGTTPNPSDVFKDVKAEMSDLIVDEPLDPIAFLTNSKLFEGFGDQSPEERTLRIGIQQTCDHLTQQFNPQKPPMLFGEPAFGDSRPAKAPPKFETQSLLAHMVVQSFGYKATSMFPYRKFATLQDGTPAVVPESTKPGDVVVIFFRHAIPVILRPIKMQNESLDHDIAVEVEKSRGHALKAKNFEHYQVVGECFVEGLMYGEAYKRYKRTLSGPPSIFALH